MSGRVAINPETGQRFVRRGAGWVDITPTAAELAAEASNPVEAFGANVAGIALDAFDSVKDLTLETRRAEFQSLYGVDVDQMRATVQQQSTERNAQLAPLHETNPVASFLGDAAAYAPLAFVPAGGSGRLISLAGREGALAAGEGFLSRPGSMGQRVRDAMLTGAMGAGGAFTLGAVSSGVNSARTLTRNSGEFSGSADLELSARNIELEMETGVPRMGEAMQREYDKLASKAPLPPDAAPGSSAAAANMDPWKRELVRTADDLGIALTTGSRTGNDQLRRIEAGLASNPLTSKPWDDLKDFNRRRVNDLALDAIGEKPGAGVLSGPDLGRAGERIGNDFGKVAARIPEFEVPADFVKKLEAAAQKHTQGFARSKSTEQYVNNIYDVLEKRGNMLDGAAMIDGRSALTAELQKASRAGDGNTMQGIYEIISAIDELMVTQGDEVTKQLYDRARGQWRILDALEQGKTVTSGGDVMVGRLDGILRRRYPQEYRRSGIAGASVCRAAGCLTRQKY